MLFIISQKVVFSLLVILTITDRHLLLAWIVINTLNHFANTTLSSLYLDITKDVLYADAIDSHQRRAVITVLEQVISHHHLHILRGCLICFMRNRF
jgi:isoleucyl-tRNA synthetase